YGEDIAAVLDWASAAGLRLADLDDDGSRVERLEQDRARLRGELAEQAGLVSAARQSAAERLGALVGAELAELAMPNARLAPTVTQREDMEAGLLLPDGRTVAFGRSGVDEVELLLSP